jgi:hypothetical protein
MSKQQRYKCFIQWHHAKKGPQFLSLSVEGTSIRRAISAALLAFFSSSSTRKERQDGHVWISITGARVKKPTAA